MQEIQGTIRLLSGQDVQANITELTRHGKSGYAKVDGREIRVEWFSLKSYQPGETSKYEDGLWYEQIDPQ